MDNNGFNDYQPPQNDPDGEYWQPRGNKDLYRARDYRAAAREALQGFWKMAVLVTLVAALLGGLTLGAPSFDFDFEIQYNDMDLQEIAQIPGMEESGYFRFLQIAEHLFRQYPILPFLFAFAAVLSSVQFLIGGPISLGYNRFKLHRLNGEEAKFADLFSAFDRFLDGLWLRVRMFLQILGWSLLLVIPGIVAAYRYSMAPYIMAENPGVTAGQAIEASKQVMNGRKWKLFSLHLSFIGWWLLSAVTLGIAALWVMPYEQMAETVFYRNLSAEIR